MDPRAELEQLLGSLIDDAPDPARNYRLGELLRVHPELQADYLDHLQIHALLQWRSGRVAPRESPAREGVLPFSTRATDRPRRRPSHRPGIAVAIVLLAIGLSAVTLFSPPEARATPDVVARLVDWNLDLARARWPQERALIHARRAPALRAALVQATLKPQERELATMLLENGDWLARNNDPVVESSRFTDIADSVLSWMDSATTAKDPTRLVDLTEAYCRIAEHGVDASIDRAIASGRLNEDGKRRLEHCMHRHAGHTQRLESLLERTPVSWRGHVRHALRHGSKYGKKRRDSGGHKGKP
jgi:hypothetical protein